MRTLAALTPREPQVVVLRHDVDLSEREVGATSGLGIGTVHSTDSRGVVVAGP